ncbi:HPr family phosphocarrier protein [Eubacteriales bacterium OttesenSCG-928-K08]|nr:HPr family phosphocarrier protein [Eubacteriales bacterium OttesenSCG-928-K08]
MINKVLIIQNPEGLRARPAAEFVQLASGFISQMMIEKGNKKVNAKSIMGVLSLGVGQGDSIHLFVNGPDEDIAMSAMVELTRKG